MKVDLYRIVPGFYKTIFRKREQFIINFHNYHPINNENPHSMTNAYFRITSFFTSLCSTISFKHDIPPTIPYKINSPHANQLLTIAYRTQNPKPPIYTNRTFSKRERANSLSSKQLRSPQDSRPTCARASA